MFCKREREEAVHWERLHEDALKGKFKHRQKRNKVPWPEVPMNFDAPAKKGEHWKNDEKGEWYVCNKIMYLTWFHNQNCGADCAVQVLKRMASSLSI